MQNEHESTRARMRNHNFILHSMTQAELALDGQDPDRMAEALRHILQEAYDILAAERRAQAEDLDEGHHLAAG